jgi:hypothetical protein
MFGKNILVKVQDLIAEYLYQHKAINIPLIGSFELNSSVNVYEIKDGKFPQDAITFQQNDQIGVDESFVNFMVERSGKMKALALSDLDSYVNNGLQLLNIGKPFTIKGIGSLTKYGNRLTFELGAPLLEKTETSGNIFVKDRARQQEEIKELNFDSKIPKTNYRKLIITLASIAALALITFAIYMAIPKQKADQPVSDETTEQTIDNNNITPLTTDTIIKLPVQDSVVAAPVTTDTSFQLLLFSFLDSARANRELAKQMLRRKNVNMQQKDSLYRIILTVNRPAADTTKVKDSLRLFYKLYSRVIQ